MSRVKKMNHWLLLSILFSPAARAAAIGDPVPNPETGRITMDASYDSTVVAERDDKCSGDGCDAKWERQTFGASLGWSVVRGLGLYGQIGQVTESIDELQYEGTGLEYGGGLRLAVPVHPSIWIAGNVHGSFGKTKSTRASQTPDPKHAEYAIYSGTLLLVAGGPSGGGHLWFGPQAAWSWTHTAWPLGDEGITLEVPLQPKRVVSGVLGATLMSDPIGVPWRASPRFRTTAEARVGQENALHVSVGVSL